MVGPGFSLGPCGSCIASRHRDPIWDPDLSALPWLGPTQAHQQLPSVPRPSRYPHPSPCVCARAEGGGGVVGPRSAGCQVTHDRWPP